MSRRCVVAVLGVAALVSLASCPSTSTGEDVTVTRIVDGDTLVVTGDVRVRLIGVDTPEVNQGGVHVNVAMAADGFAHQLTIPPNVAHADEFGAAVAAARLAGRGLWGAGCQSGVPLPPAGAPPGSAEPPIGSCDPSYPTLCIPPGIPDLDCPDITERAFLVLPPDPHRFDGNRDGVGCESP